MNPPGEPDQSSPQVMLGDHRWHHRDHWGHYAGAGPGQAGLAGGDRHQDSGELWRWELDIPAFAIQSQGGAWVQCGHNLWQQGGAGGGRGHRGWCGGVPGLGHQVRTFLVNERDELFQHHKNIFSLNFETPGCGHWFVIYLFYVWLSQWYRHALAIVHWYR